MNTNSHCALRIRLDRLHVSSESSRRLEGTARELWLVFQGIKEAVRNTFIHVSGKPVENPSCGGSVKKLHRASKDPSEKLIVEPGGGSQRALRSTAQSGKGPEAQGLRQAQFLPCKSQLHRTSIPKTGEGQMAMEEGGGETANTKRLRLRGFRSFQHGPACCNGAALLRMNPRGHAEA